MAWADNCITIDPAQARVTRLRKGLGIAAKQLHNMGARNQQIWMQTLTSAGTNKDWRPEHISRYLDALRKWHYARTGSKKVRYACGLFGHRVRAVSERDGFVEYACFCGHSFLKGAEGARTIRHPLVCFFFAHRILFVTTREGYAEYVCRDCGHPFCFAVPGFAAAAAPEQRPAA